MNRGIRRVGVAVVVLFLALVGQLVHLQVFSAETLENDPLNVRALVRDYARPRGRILTADGREVARSEPTDDELERQRVYPLGPLLSHVAGYQSFLYGNTGVEAFYNDELVGRDLELALRGLADLFGEQDATGTVVLSVRADIQEVARDALGDQHGSVVVLEPGTGAIVAMYSNPSFDPQPLAGHSQPEVEAYWTLLNANPDQPALARAYREIYPAGSTFKIVTTAVGLEQGVVETDTEFPSVREIELPLTTNTLRNFGGQVCGGDLVESFVRSCNTTFGALGLALGEGFVTGMEAFGIGSAPPLDLRPGAVASTGPEPGTFERNQPLFAFAGIGQGDVAVTPLQMALVAAAVANDGVIMEPHVADRIEDADLQVVRRITPEPWRRAMSPATAATIREMMVQVVERGTGTAARIPGVQVAGKTGTAQQDGGPPHAWFVAFAPADAPEYVVAVLVERGGSAGDEATGGAVAAPVAARVLRALLGV
ncbi:MAG: penicillin-binding transpeptidase domain-containing protein [Acidimicrobiia bacterium]|nr:penicillin-binding transpeptidase domain-containing protein [Acidimicrobiia bacterium]